MSHLAGAVTVVTVREGDHAVGMTASTVTSLSLEPPLLLVCVDRRAAIYKEVGRQTHFGVNVLAGDQEAIARRFAERERARIELSGALSPAGLPLIEGALAHLDCQRAEIVPAGDHVIVTGTPVWSTTRPGPALIYFMRRYGSFG